VRAAHKIQIQEWIDDTGKTAISCASGVRGLPPRASELQFIDQERIWAGQKRTSLRSMMNR